MDPIHTRAKTHQSNIGMLPPINNDSSSSTSLDTGNSISCCTHNISDDVDPLNQGGRDNDLDKRASSNDTSGSVPKSIPSSLTFDDDDIYMVIGLYTTSNDEYHSKMTHSTSSGSNLEDVMLVDLSQANDGKSID